MSDWGKGVNNNIGWGQGADNNIGWGSIYDKSNAGETLLSGGGFSPLSLFSNGEQGAWYDPSDLSTLFQDAAGTTPVTASGDPVGLFLDKSGNNNHAKQSISVKRPTYMTDGTLHWLNFDGVDDVLVLTRALEPYFNSFIGNSSRLLGGIDDVFLSDGISSTPGVHIGYNDGDEFRIFTSNNIFVAPLNNIIADNERHVLTIVINDTSSASINGNLLGTKTKIWNNLNLRYIGGFIEGGNQSLEGNIYGLIAVSGGVYTEEELKKVESYVANKTGI